MNHISHITLQQFIQTNNGENNVESIRMSGVPTRTKDCKRKCFCSSEGQPFLEQSGVVLSRNVGSLTNVLSRHFSNESFREAEVDTRYILTTSPSYTTKKMVIQCA